MSNLRTEVCPTTFLLLMLYICVPTSLLPVFVAFKTVEDFSPSHATLICNAIPNYSFTKKSRFGILTEHFEATLIRRIKMSNCYGSCHSFPSLLVDKALIFGKCPFWLSLSFFLPQTRPRYLTRLQHLKHQLMSS